MTFNQIALAYPERVQVLFSKYGITQTVNGESLLSASMIYGDTFIDELIKEINNNDNFFIGSGLLAGKIKGAFTKAKDLLNKNNIGTEQTTGGKGKKIFQIVAGLFGNNPEEQIKQEIEEPKKDNSKMLFYGLGGLVLIVLVYLVVTKL